MDAEPDTKELLLKELEEFAFRGIPDFQKSMRCVEGSQTSSEDVRKNVFFIFSDILCQFFKK